MSQKDADHSAPPEYHPLPALLSYLVPGLGQIYQGRIAKGVVFFVCVLTLFYYGMFLSKWHNVYLPDVAEHNNPRNYPRLAVNLYNRPQFVCQFWVGIAAWPAVVQYATYDPDAEAGRFFGTYQRMPYESRSELYPKGKSSGETPEERRATRVMYRTKIEADYSNRLNDIKRNNKDLDPRELQVKIESDEELIKIKKEMANVPLSALRDWDGKTLNEMQAAGDKNWDLGWVFTVIAGVLNLMVIYDALAGPAYLVVREPERELVEVS